MKGEWDAYLLSTVSGTAETPYHLNDGMIVFRGLPFLVQSSGTKPPNDVEVLRTWERYEGARVRILAGLDWAYTQNAHVYRLSLGFLPRPYDAGDALAVAIRTLLERNRIVVAAVGNWGPKHNTLSELARFPGVIAVGATAADGALLRSSSRGTADGTCPTVVANGSDVGEDALPPGTSFAAARVASFCAYLRSMLHWLALDLTAVRDGNWSAERPPPSCLAHLDTGFNLPAIQTMIQERRAKMLVMKGDVGVEWSFGFERRDWLESVFEAFLAADLHFDVRNSPGSVRRLLSVIADSRPCADPVGCGAGFVSQELLVDFLRDMTPSRFYSAFGEEHDISRSQKLSLQELDNRQGPLWDDGTFALSWHEYHDKHDDIFIRVL